MEGLTLPAKLDALVSACNKPYDWNGWQHLMWECRVAGLDVKSFRSHDAYKHIMARRFGSAWEKLLPKRKPEQEQSAASSSQDIALPDAIQASVGEMTKPVSWNEWQKLLSSHRAFGRDVRQADQHPLYLKAMAERFGPAWREQMGSVALVLLHARHSYRVRIWGKQSPKKVPTEENRTTCQDRSNKSGPHTNRKLASTVVCDMDKLKARLDTVHRDLPISSSSSAGQALHDARSIVKSIMKHARLLESRLCTKVVKRRGYTAQTLENLKKGRAVRQAQRNKE